MILDSLDRIDLYANLHPRLREGFALLKRKDLATLPVGRTTIHPWLHVDIVKADMCPRESRQVEVHRRYVDIHAPLSGQEMIGWMEAGRCRNLVKTMPEKDADLFQESCASWGELKPGFFALYFTGEGHAPMVGAGPIHKAVVKIALVD